MESSIYIYDPSDFTKYQTAGRESFKEILPNVTNGKFIPDPKAADEPETSNRVGEPIFKGNAGDRDNFTTLSRHLAKLIKEHSNHTKNVIIGSLSPQIFACSATVVDLQRELEATKEALARSVDVAKEAEIASEAKYEALKKTITSQHEIHNNKLQLLVPGDVANYEKFQEEIKASITAGITSSEAHIENKFREGLSNQTRTIKNTMLKGPAKPGNGVKTGNGSNTIGSDVGATNKNVQEKVIEPQEPEEPKMVSLPRQFANKKADGSYEHGYEIVTAKERKPRNRNNQIKTQDMIAKDDRRAQLNTERAARELLIFGLPTPAMRDKAREITNIMTLMEELKTNQVGDKGVNIQKKDLIDLQCERLWNWGGPDFKGEKPLKVLFKKQPIVDKIKEASKAAGIWIKRRYVNFGMYKDKEKDLPESYIRGSTTLEQRLKFKERDHKRKEHEETAEYQRYKAVQERNKEFKCKLTPDDLPDEMFVVEEEGEKDEIEEDDENDNDNQNDNDDDNGNENAEGEAGAVGGGISNRNAKRPRTISPKTKQKQNLSPMAGSIHSNKSTTILTS